MFVFFQMSWMYAEYINIYTAQIFPRAGKWKTSVFKSRCLWSEWGFVLRLGETKSGPGQFMYLSPISTFRQRASWEVFWVVPGFRMYPSEHGRTGSWKLEVQGWNGLSIPITIPEEHKDTKHGSATCKITWLSSVSWQWLLASGVKEFSESLHGKTNHIHLPNFSNFFFIKNSMTSHSRHSGTFQE